MLSLDQGGADANALAQIQELSQTEFNALNSEEVGKGVMVWGKKVVLFDAKISKENELYPLINTNFHEKAKEAEKKKQKQRQEQQESNDRIEEIILQMAELAPVTVRDLVIRIGDHAGRSRKTIKFSMPARVSYKIGRSRQYPLSESRLMLMAVKKAKEASFKRMDSAFATSQSAIQKVKNTDPLNGNEEQEQGNENVSIDPAHYLSKKEKKEWKRLSYTAKQRYIRQAERQLKRQKKRNGIAKTEPSSVQEKEKQAAKIFSKERKYQSSTWKEPVDKKEIGSHGGNGEIASKSRDSRAAIRSQSTVAGGEKAVDIASSASAETAKAAGNATAKTVDTAAVSTGAGLAALVAKKTAENFKEMLQQKNTAIESQRIKTQTKLSQLIEENKTGSPGVAAAAMLASVVVTVMYFAAQIAVTIFFVLLILLIPIIVIVSFLGIIITLLSGFAAAVDNTDYASGSGASIVAVAVQEIGYHEGAGNHTKYGVYTGTDGMSWCHAFVSWCANECGFIESNIIPKTAACETGRQWFIHKQQYQKAGSYTPQAGDIIYFDRGGVGESHHVGIVEYVENGIVHTIEGNKNNQVMRGHYELTYKGIMGYGTPDYPDEGLTSSTASEILSKAQELGKMMVEEKWVYSNY